MTRTTFEKAIKLLTDTYGPSAYPQTRIELIWDEVSHLPDEFFRTRVVDWVGSRMKPMVLDHFREVVVEKKEVDWTEKKARERSGTRPGIQHKLADMAGRSTNLEFAKKCAWLINQVMTGRIDKPKFWQYQAQLSRMGDQLAPQDECQRCFNSGMEFSYENGIRFLHRCICPIGVRKNADFMASQKKADVPMQLTVKKHEE